VAAADVVAELDLMTRPAPARPVPARRAPVRPAPVDLRRRLGLDHPEPAWWGWAVAAGMGVLAGVLRLRNLGDPPTLVFDETYYVKQAYSMLLSGGVELRWSNDDEPRADDLWNAGTYDVFTSEGDASIVHPPLGKWMIATGIRAMGVEDPASWRIAAALAGTLSVVVLVLVARRLFSSTLLGGTAGLLLAVDGHHVALSRIGLLDIFLSFLALVGFAFVLADRYATRERLARRLTAGGTGPPRRDATAGLGPWLLWRPWLVAAGVALGGATAVKWSGLWFLAALGLLVVAWDIGARRVAGVRQWFSGGVIKDGPVAFVLLVPVAALTYLATWTGWFASDRGHDRYWAQENPDSALARWLPDTAASFAHWHERVYEFHSGLVAEHIYSANPWSWPVQARPTLFFHEPVASGQLGCAAEECKRDILALGNPVLWWAGVAAVVVALLAWALRRDWRAGALLVPLAAGWLPWLAFQDRLHVFTFYAVAFVPYIVLAVTYSLGLLIGPPEASRRRRAWGAGIAATYVVSVIAVSAWFWPMWVGDVMTVERWQTMMWWPSWRQ
jgi:dolichyl-phosphate-mannose--protein O-mannosyl transferase